MLDQAVRRAMQKLAATFASNYKHGMEYGKIAGGLTLAAVPLTYILTKPDGKGKTKEVNATKQKSIHLDDEGNLNTSGQGELVAAVYKDDDGHYHKKTKDRWYSWDGTDWV